MSHFARNRPNNAPISLSDADIGAELRRNLTHGGGESHMTVGSGDEARHRARRYLIEHDQVAGTVRTTSDGQVHIIRFRGSRAEAIDS